MLNCQGKQFPVTQFDISVFERGVSIDQNAMNNAAATVPNGYAAEPLAAALVWTIGSIASDKEVVIQIAGKIDNLPFSRSSSETQRGRVTEKSIKDTVDEALENVLIQIKTIIPAK